MSETPEKPESKSPEEEEENPTATALFQASLEDLLGELKRRYPLGTVVLMRQSLGNADLEYFNPCWGNPFFLMGALTHQLNALKYSTLSGGTSAIASSRAGDEASLRRAWDEEAEEEDEDETEGSI